VFGATVGERDPGGVLPSFPFRLVLVSGADFTAMHEVIVAALSAEPFIVTVQIKQRVLGHSDGYPTP
jgi:hypothetical protein